MDEQIEKQLEFTNEEISRVMSMVTDLGTRLGYHPQVWAALLGIVSAIYSDAQSVEVVAERIERDH